MTVNENNNLKNIGGIPDDQENDVFIFPASYAQKRMWFLDQFEPDSPYYNIPMAFEIKGSFDIQIFTCVINEIIRRHESLRTIFKVVGRQPFQVILPELKLSIPVLDMNDKDEEEITREVKSEISRPFNLSSGPLIRVKVIKKSEAEFVIILTVHHIVSDGWSMGILLSEIGILYNAFAGGISSPLPDPEIQYADYSEWQREYLQGPVIKKQMDYWKGRLGIEPPVLNLPTDRPRPLVYTNSGASCSVKIAGGLFRQIKELCRTNNSTLFMTLLAAFKVLLCHYSRQKDIAVGTPIAGRSNKESEQIIGVFINTLVIRSALGDNPSFTDYLARIKQILLDAYENQDLPFEMLVEELQPERDMSYMPLFQVMFIMQNTPSPEELIKGLTLDLLDVEMGTSTCDMTLSVSEESDALDLALEYNTDLFNRSTVERFLHHYINLLGSITASPEKRVLDFSLPDEAETELILNDFNPASSEAFEGFCVHQLFELEAEKTPASDAVVCSGIHLSYSQLNENANRLAHLLIEKGTAPESVTGIFLERSVHLMEAVLGVLKAGGVYLPLDPNYPPDRINFMLSDSGAAAVITQRSLLNILPSFSGTVICIDEEENFSGLSINGSEIPTNPSVSVSGENLAYIIYTSGSTGRPKGTMIRHSSLVNALKGWEDSYELRSRARNHVQMASFSFDVFTADWVRALCTGGKLILVPREMLLEAEMLYSLMLSERADYAEFVPAVLRNLIDYLARENKNLNFLSLLVAGSDIWYVNEYRRFKEFCGSSTRLINSYGVTEATIDSSFYEGSWIALGDECNVPIGVPFANIRLYILNEKLRPVPVGVHGELFIGGAGLARGYLNRPDLTAEKFIPDPFSGIAGCRLYRTGDLARYMPDGNIEFLGRGDSQIKIRGFRIELGEIETALQKHPCIKEAAVVVRESANEKIKRLAAYFTLTNGAATDNNEIREYLQSELPDYMIPSAFVELGSMPLTPNGKVDRKALPDPGMNNLAISSDNQYRPPRDNTEAHIAGIWQELLDLPQVGIDDNFFDLGGHSLLATQVISRVNETFNAGVPLRSIFERPTVEGLAVAVRKAMDAPGRKTGGILKSDSSGPLPLSYSQQRLWFLEQMEPGLPFYNMTDVYLVKGSIKLELLERSVNEVVRRQESLRTVFVSSGGIPEQVIVPELKISIPFFDLTILNEPQKKEKTDYMINEEASRPFDISKAPLFRAVLIKVEAEKYVIIFTVHHIISDDWSNRILFEEIGAFYKSLLSDEMIQLPGLGIQYKDFAIWQREWLKGNILGEHLDYWKSKLNNAAPVLDLPFDHPRPAVQSYHGDYITFEFSPSQAEALNGLCRRNGVTPFMALLTIFKILLFKYSGQKDILIGTPIAGRNHEEIERIIGFFVNTLVIRTDFSGDQRFSELLGSVRKSVIEAFDYQDLPFEFLLEALHVERNVSHSPLFQVMFVMQNYNSKQNEENAGLVFEPLEAHSGTAKFELTLFILEDSGKYSAAFEYNSSLFEKETVLRMAGHFRFLLDSVLQADSKRISELQLMTREEIKALLSSYNQPPQIKCLTDFVPAAFELQARKTPGKNALAFMNYKMSYAELNRRVNQLARYLQKYFSGPENIAGIYLDRSPEMVISLLAVLRAGGAYLPLGLNLPPERTEFMIQESEASVIITKSSFMPAASWKNVVCLDQLMDIIEKEDEGSLQTAIEGDSLAYIIYTSGSTGKPKGVQISHNALRNYMNWTLNAYPVEVGSGSALYSTIMFDATATSIFPVLLSGGEINIIPEDQDFSVLSSSEAQAYDYSLIKITPAHLEALSYEFENKKISKFTKAFVIGGENLRADQIRFYQEKHKNTLLFNEYGPTETTVGCVVFEASQWQGSGSVPVGKVIPGVRIYILDGSLNPVIQGTPGELYIAGEGVARGYINHPDLTAEKFLPDPFAPLPGERMYRTGDLVKLLRDGNIEFLGRIDSQVKIRGYRIEPGEIEAALSALPGIQETAAIVRKDIVNEPKLVAYYTSEDKIETTTIKEYLKGKLPDYMIPSFYVQLDSFPLTGNGKVDRKALPAPSLNIETEQAEKKLPSNKVEEILLSLWSEVLGIKNIGVTDNFFDIGGDSIISIQIIARANQLGLKLTPRLIFQYPTIEGLARAAYSSEALSAEQGQVTGPAPLTPIQHWFFAQDLPDKHHYNQSVLLRTEKHVDAAILRKAVNLLIEHHDALRMSFHQLSDQSWIQFCPEFTNDAEIELFELTDDTDPSSEIFEITSGIQKSFALRHGHLFKAAVITQKNAGRNWIFITVHHLVADGITWRILLDDLLSLYASLADGAGTKLPLKTASYKAWSISLTEYVNSGSLAGQTDYWIRQTEMCSGAGIPVDFSGADTEASAVTASIHFDETVTNQLLYEIPPVYHTAVNDILIAALLKTITWFSGRETVAIDIEGHGREDLAGLPDVSRTVGWFTSIYPLALFLEESADTAGLIMKTKEALRNVPDKGFGYGLLKYLSDGQEALKLRKYPAPDILFNYLGIFSSGSFTSDEFTICSELSAPDRCQEAFRSHLLEINCGISDRRLNMEWTYSRNIFREETISSLLNKYNEVIMEIISHCRSSEAGCFSQSDFSDFGWSPDEIDSIISKVNKFQE